MKLLIKLLGLLMLGGSLSAQHTFELSFDGPLDERPLDVFQTANSDYYIAAVVRTGFYDPMYSTVVRLSETGEVLNQAEIINPEEACILFNLIQVSPDTIVGIGEWKHPGDDSEIWYIGFDSLLNVRWQKKYYIPGDWVVFIRSCLSDFNQIVTVLSCCYSPNMTPARLMFVKTSSMGDTLFTKTIIPFGSGDVFDIVNYDTGFKAIITGLTSDYRPKITFLDNSFNVLSLDSIPNHLDLAMTMKIRDDTSMYISGRYPHNSQTDIGVELLSNEGELMFFNFTGDETLRDYPGAEQSMDLTPDKNVLTAGTYNQDPYVPYYSNYHSYYALNRFDSALNFEWTRLFGGDAYYFLRQVIATSDGGALLSGSKYDDTNPEDQLDIYIVKVDSSGLFTGLDPETDPRSTAINLYPNPSSDYVILETGSLGTAGQCIFSDMRGVEVMKHTLQQAKTRINTSALAPGFYVYTVIAEGKVIGRGKWIKYQK